MFESIRVCRCSYFHNKFLRFLHLYAHSHYLRTHLCIFYRCTVHFEIYVDHSPTNALFITTVKSFTFTLKYTIISLLHVSVSFCTAHNTHATRLTLHRTQHTCHYTHSALHTTHMPLDSLCTAHNTHAALRHAATSSNI